MMTQTTQTAYYLHLYHDGMAVRCFPVSSVEQAVESVKFMVENGIMFPGIDNWGVCDSNVSDIINDGNRIYPIR